MTIEYDKLIAVYVEWIRTKTAGRVTDGVCEITTPFLDRHNDRIQIHIAEANGLYRLSDDGQTVDDLIASGVSLDSETRKTMMKTIVNKLGVKLEDGELYVDATPDTFPRCKLRLIQSILAINDMYMVSRPNVAGMFKEDVGRFLSGHNIPFVDGAKVVGRSGYEHDFDYVLPPSATAPQRYLKSISQPTRANVQSLLFAWTDTRAMRAENSTAFAFLNDADKPVRNDVLASFRRYRVRPILWSQREAHVQELAA